MNAYQLYRENKYKAYDESNEMINSINNDITSFEILTRKKQNGIPEDILGLTPIDISRRDILLSDVKRGLDNDEELSLELDEAVRYNKLDGWRDGGIKEKKLRIEVNKIINDPQKTMELMDIIKAQSEY